MEKQWQFQNITWRKDMSEFPTVIQPGIALPVRREPLVPVTPPLFFEDEQETAAMLAVPESVEMAVEASVPLPVSRQKKLLRSILLILILFLGIAIYFTWQSATAPAVAPTVVQQNFGNPTANSGGAASTTSSETIMVYILGAIARPGIYKLPADARVYQLVQDAGGLLPNANAVALNMAARLTDGEEIYVLSVGETAPPGINSPPGSNNGTPGTSGTLAPGQLVNINTATEAQMMQVLHVSSATANKIIAYRTQHGPYTAVSQLLQVVSKSIYDRIKNMVTV